MMIDKILGNARQTVIFMSVKSEMSIKRIGAHFTFTNEVIIASI